MTVPVAPTAIDRSIAQRCQVLRPHHWSRELQALGHTVRLMPPAYVKPYVKRQKNDSTDAEAICEAVTRPNMHFVHPCRRTPRPFSAAAISLKDVAPARCASRMMKDVGGKACCGARDNLPKKLLKGLCVLIALDPYFNLRRRPA